MAEYRIFETDEFRKKLRSLDVRQRSFVESKLKKLVYPQLRIQPRVGRNIKTLQGYDPDTWRYRIGRFRIFFGIDDESRIVSMLSLDDRKDAYRP